MASADLDFLFLQFLFQRFQQWGHIARLSRVWFKEAAVTSQNLLNPQRSYWLLWLSPDPPPQGADGDSAFPVPLQGLLAGPPPFLCLVRRAAPGEHTRKPLFSFTCLVSSVLPHRPEMSHPFIHWSIHSFRKSSLRASHMYTVLGSELRVDSVENQCSFPHWMGLTVTLDFEAISKDNSIIFPEWPGK